jgi:hypothetical protein
MRKSFPVVGQFSQSAARRYDNQDTVNMYIDDMNEESSVHSITLNPFPGYEEFLEIPEATGTPRINGIFSYLTNTYVAFGTNVFKVDQNNIIEKLSPATLFSITTPLSWANSSTQIAVADGVALYVYDIPTNNFTQITLPTGIPSNPFVVYYQDARLFIRFENDPRVYFSAQGDFTQLSSNNFEIQESRPSIATGLTGVNERLFLLGDVSTEVWFPPTSNTANPIIR